MLWSSIYEISLCIGFILIVIYGLFSLSTPTLGLDSKIFQAQGQLLGPYIAQQYLGPKKTIVDSRKELAFERGFSRNLVSGAHLVNLYINDVYFFSRLWPIMFLLGYSIDFISEAYVAGNLVSSVASEQVPLNISTQVLVSQEAGLLDKEAQLLEGHFAGSNNGIDLLLIILTIIIMQSFKSFESNLLLLLAFVGQIFMLHSCDLVSFYICLELQNFCFLVLCGLQPRAIQFNIPGFYISATQAAVTQETKSLSFLYPWGRTAPGSKSVKTNTNNFIKPGLAELPGGLRHPGIISLTGSRPLAGVEATIKYLLLSAFSSGVLLFWFSILYLKTGITSLVPPLSFLQSKQPFSAYSYFFAKSTQEDLAKDNSLHGTYCSSINDVYVEGNKVPQEANSLETLFPDTVIFGAGGPLFTEGMPQMLILIALMFKLGGAPLHLWMIDIYGGAKRQLLMYISTAPKLSFFGFWVSTWHSVWTDFSLLIFVAFSMIIGSFGAYSQPTLRSLFAYSTVNEIGLMLMAIETAGFHSLFQHLTIYIVTMLLLWNNSDKRVFAILAVSLAGLPPLAGFFGKAWIFNSVATGSFAGPYIGILLISLFCTGLSLVYYLRVFRLFFMGAPEKRTHGFSTPNISSFALGVFRKVGFGSLFNNIIIPAGVESHSGVTHNMGIETRTYGFNFLSSSGGLGAGLFFPSVKLTSFCVIFLIFAPLFYIKPFVL